MSDKSQRKSIEIQQEYSQTCARAGHIQFQIDQLKNDLKLANESLSGLNFEHLAAVKAEREASAIESKESSNVQS